MRSACSAPIRGATRIGLPRRLVYVPGDVTLWPNLTGAEIIDLLGRLRTRGIAIAALGAAGLIGLRHRDLGDLGPSRPVGTVRDWVVADASFVPSRQAAEHE